VTIGRTGQLQASLTSVIPAALLLSAVYGRWPYSVYILMRIVVCGCAIYLALRSTRTGRTAWVWILGGMAVLFNPVLPIRMHRSDWQVVDFISAAVLVAHAVLTRDSPG